jgi:hypothetical protein
MASRAAQIALLLATATACGGSGRSPDFWVHDVGVHVETDAPFAHQPDFPRRVESVLDVALRYWGGDWSHVAGRTVTFAAGPYVACGGADRAIGCYDGDVTVTASEAATGHLPCVELTVLAHEIGHAVVGDPRHEDPRWMQFEPVRDALDGRAGYGSEGEAACLVAVSVWRHPLGRP